MLHSTLLLSAANFAMRGIAMAFQVYLTGQVGAAGIGLLQLIMTVHGFALTLGSSGIRVASMYLSAEEYGLGRLHGVRQAMIWCLSVGFLLSCFVGGAMALGAQALALNWVKDLRAAPALTLLGLTLPLTCLSAIAAGYFTACGKIRRLVAVEMADRIVTALATVWLLRLGHLDDLSHACIAIVGGGALASLGSVAVLLWFMAQDFHASTTQKLPGMGRRLLRFCLPVALNDYLRSGLGTLEQFLIPYGLSRREGSRTSALADYGTIHGMVFPVLLLPNTILLSVVDLLIPRLARWNAQEYTTQIQTIAHRCLRACLIFSFAIGGFLFLTAESLGQLLYHSQSAGQYLRLFAPLIPMLYLDCIVDGMHKGLGQQITCVRINTLTNLLDVIFLYLLLPRYGIGGYFFTYTLTHAINFALSLRKLLVVTELIPSIGFLLTTLLVLLLSTAIAATLYPHSIGWSALLTRGGSFLAVFFLLLSLGKHFDKQAKSR